MRAKICTKCGTEFPPTLEFFNKSTTGKFGLKAKCKKCCHQWYREYKQPIGNASETKVCTVCHRELPATLQNFPRQKTGKFGLRSKCKLCHRREVAEYRKANPEKTKELLRRSRKKMRVRIREYKKQYREKYKKEIKSYMSQYHKENLARGRIYTKTRKAKIKGGSVKGFGSTELRRWIESQKPLRCYLCEKKIKAGEQYQIEHRIPLSRGGKHAPWNLAIAHPFCNNSKHDKTPSEFAPDRFRPELPL